MSTKPFIRIAVSVKVELVQSNLALCRYDRKAIVVAPERAQSDVLLQESVVTALAEKLMGKLDEINTEHAERHPHSD